MANTETQVNEVAPIVGDPMYFSATTKTIYRLLWKDRYVAGTGWPDDAKLLTDDQFQTYGRQAPTGQTLGADSSGNPTWVNLPVPTDAEAAIILGKRVDKALDYVAGLWGYTRGIDNATTWSTSSNPQFAAEGQALATWRDQVWDWVKVQPAGSTDISTLPPIPTRPQISGGAQ